MHHDIIGRVERLALELLGEHGDLAREIVARDAARGVLAGNLAAFAVEGVAVAEIGIAPHDAHMPVLGQITHLRILRNVAPHEVASAAVPRGALRPEASGVQAADGRVPLDVFLEGVLQRNDVRIRIARGLGMRAEVAGDERSLRQ